jgi:hypothetical protein
MLRCAQSPLVNVPPQYASSRRSFARLASEIFLSSLQSGFFRKRLDKDRNYKVEIQNKYDVPDRTDRIGRLDFLILNSFPRFVSDFVLRISGLSRFLGAQPW